MQQHKLDIKVKLFLFVVEITICHFSLNVLAYLLSWV